MLSGVSVGCTRIEQGQTNNASPAVLLDIARALRLGPQQRAYLLALAAPEGTKVREYAQEEVSDALTGLLATLGDVAGMILGRRLDLWPGHLWPTHSSPHTSRSSSWPMPPTGRTGDRATVTVSATCATLHRRTSGGSDLSLIRPRTATVWPRLGRDREPSGRADGGGRCLV